MNFQSMPIMPQSILARMPHHLRVREEFLIRVKHQATMTAERTAVQLVEESNKAADRREAWQERIRQLSALYPPDPEGPARMQLLMDEDRQTRKETK